MDKFERLLNLTAALLHTAQPLSASELRERMAGAYSEDKGGLQADVRTRQSRPEGDRCAHRGLDPLPARPAGGGLPHTARAYVGRDVRFDPDELAALHLATNLVRLEGGSGAGLARLGGAASAGAAGSVEEVGELPFHDSLGRLVAAAIGRREVSFVYREAERRIEPWRLSFHRGHWYLVGWDVGHGEERMFRVDRIDSEVTDLGDASHPVGEGPDPRTLRPWEFGPGRPVEVPGEGGRRPGKLGLPPGRRRR